MTELNTQSIRDPIYDWIPFNESEKKIIDSPLMQRLKYVSQLTGIYQVFPGGIHNRFSHSLGAMHVAGLYADHVSRFLVEREELESTVSRFKQLARLSALLHDIGHGPWSHAYDRAIYPEIYGVADGGHDCHRLKIVESDLLAPLIQKTGLTVADIQQVWLSKKNHDHCDDPKNLSLPNKSLYTVISHLIQGPIGADRMDFTLRDSYFTGTEHFGTIAYRRIIHNSTLGCDNASAHYFLAYHQKSLDDIEQALDGRFYMYKGIYFHKTCMAVEILIQEMMTACVRELKLVARTTDLAEFVDLHDASMIGSILNLPRDHPARQLWNRISRRQLPKMVWERLVPVAELTIKENDFEEAVGNYLLAQELISTNESQDLWGAGVRWTRIFGGMNAEKFDQLGIRVNVGASASTSATNTYSRFTDHQREKDQKYLLIRRYLG